MNQKFMNKAFITLICVAIACFASLYLSLPSFAYADTESKTYNVTVTGTYHQSDAYSMLAMINRFRTAKIDENDGNTPWAWNKGNTEKVHYDGLGTLKWDSELEEIAMQRAAESALYFSHTRPNGKFCTTVSSTNGYHLAGENLTFSYDDFFFGIYDASSAFESLREDYASYEGQGHRINMLQNFYTAVGIACFEHNGARYWSMALGFCAGTQSPTLKDSTEKVNIEVDSSVVDVSKISNASGNGKNNGQTYVPGSSSTAEVTMTAAPAISAPAKTSISKLAKAKKAFTVKWKKKSGVAGYQIRYSLKSSMKGSKAVTVKSAKTTAKKVGKLKKKKKYYVQVRTYKVVNGKAYWSGWSTKKSVKTK